MQATTPIRKMLSGDVSVGSVVEVHGWVRTRRDSKAGLSFIQCHDGSCFDAIQIVAEKTLPNYESEILKLTSGCAISVKGELVESQGKNQNVELKASDVTVVGWVENPDTYPIQPKRHSMEYLREVAHLRPRTNTFSAVTRLRHRVALAIHQFFNDRDFFWVNTPIITASDCEGAGELFRVSTLDMVNPPKRDDNTINFEEDFFGRETFLTVSGQLNVEAYALAMSRVYTFGPTFRAENSNTSRHLAEFWMIEPEIAFGDLSTVIKLAEDLLKAVFSDVLNNSAEDMAFFNQWIDKTCIARLENVIKHDFTTMTYDEAIDILTRAKNKFEFPVTWGHDLQTEHERYLAEEHVGKPVTIINYPAEIKGFYMKLNDDEKTVAAMDVLAPGIGEIIGGSQREDRLDVLDQRMKQLGLSTETYDWYRDLRRYGSVPHAGFGLGFERLISYITGLSNVRDVIPFPRTPNNVSF